MKIQLSRGTYTITLDRVERLNIADRIYEQLGGYGDYAETYPTLANLMRGLDTVDVTADSGFKTVTIEIEMEK